LVTKPFFGGVAAPTGPHIVIVEPEPRAPGLMLLGLITPI
jgi:hypothetical protein